MKILIVISLVAATCAANVIPQPGQIGQMKEYSRFINMSDDKGNPRRVDLEARLEEAALRNITAEFNEYWLYTRSNPNEPQYLYPGQPGSVIASNFNFDKPVIVSVHGWVNSGHTDPNPGLIPVLLDKDDYNVIVLDWSVMANTDYLFAVAAVPVVGRGLGQFMAFLNSLGVPWTNMHLIGFSLGAHLVGNAGREVGGRIARITSLDPAGPFWYDNPDCVAPTDAVFVEGIHTDGGADGIGTPIGDVDFFPNGGSSQTGCADSSCNHHRAWELLAATITLNHLWGNHCTSMAQVLIDRCSGPLLPMGNDDLNKSGSGIYRVNTQGVYPF